MNTKPQEKRRQKATEEMMRIGKSMVVGEKELILAAADCLHQALVTTQLETSRTSAQKNQQLKEEILKLVAFWLGLEEVYKCTN